jgi:hypothetical protein
VGETITSTQNSDLYLHGKRSHRRPKSGYGDQPDVVVRKAGYAARCT